MKVNKKVLTLILGLGMMFTVGCSTNSSEGSSPTTTEFVENEVNNETNSENNTKNAKKSSKKTLSEKEALKIVEDEVKKIMPDAKFRVQGKTSTEDIDGYTIIYDTPFYTKTKFLVDAVSGELSVVDNSKMTLKDWEEDVLNIKSNSPYEQEFALELLKKIETEEPGQDSPGLSANQLASLELASDFMVKTPYNYCWVYRYPMEEKHQWVTESEKEETYDNALSLDDKYGYIFIDPYRKEYTGYLGAEAWNPMDWAVEHFGL